ncbi:hypothetical protein FEM03_11485 [Phragmitibacter flavus]|uniref:Uncharacterized protein n=2 Tax=Phragmitibacter flavus TaxID=2576071 RepID=A0A5R8KDG4_9BACT|nr:hypothetical protein FEM03_11485 [Phragmitibacter flavus]
MVGCITMGGWTAAQSVENPGAGLGQSLAGSPPAVVELPAPEPRRVRQPVQEYVTVMDPVDGGVQRLEQAMNPFVSYTHLGTDFGFIGQSNEGVGWQVGTVRVDMPQGRWGGMWHALAGLGADRGQTLDFSASFPSFITAKFQPKIVGVEFRAKGRGQFKLEIKGVDEELLWSKSMDLDSPDLRTFVENLEPEKIGKAKFLNWVAEAGAQAELDSLAFIVEAPAIAYDEYVFLSSYAKLARCYSSKHGFVRDRAHTREGLFDNVPASGLFALATALASRQGMVEEAFAREVLMRIHQNVAGMASANGWLPHFVRLDGGGRYEIVPGTEFSTVDSSLYFHSMLLASEILGDGAIKSQVAKMIQSMTLENLVDAQGYIGHGFRDGGVKDPLPSVWRDWGGETALVLGLVKMIDGALPPRMLETGRVHDGVGFIVEIQSLFYPDFDTEVLDAVSRQNWLGARREMLKRQREYFSIHWPESRAAKLGFYGLSAGEARLGLGYMVSGVDLPKQSFLHPHYVLMSASTDERPENVYDVLRRMESEQLFPPWGMVENFDRDVQQSLPMQSALNGGFESIGAYHLLVRHRRQSNAVHEASLRNEDLRKAGEMFFPLVPTSFKGGK